MFRSQMAKAFYNQLKKDDSRAFGYGTEVEAEKRQGVKLSLFPELEAEIVELKKYDYEYWEIPNTGFVTSQIAQDTAPIIREKVLGLINQ